MRHFVDIRSRFGGPSPEPMNEALDNYRQQIDDLMGSVAQASQRINAAKELRHKAFGTLLETT